MQQPPAGNHDGTLAQFTAERAERETVKGELPPVADLPEGQNTAALQGAPVEAEDAVLP
ncbi:MULTISPECIES: hypothetical protein [unclassified Arthrobacter]|uniref:hypothetical protein n=1 Tax=unclassified Pseudarthrobacter TaxID=2647000 RepID=UPI003397E947